ncbi:dTDP-4-dehydrorhamnose 3,5-epimerase family protein [Spongiactinospora sp. 9N601]|uniref:dTDP-4-dehydrorhamnose 3,5-epimerase family protein n=1 Tax=Spongiactinospora sp. 9N601 TaxID=3375149 RepID=UPI003792AB1E
MKSRELAVIGAFEFIPDTFPDDRGLFVSPFQEAAFVRAVGHPLFPVAQTSHSVSRRGVLRGIHYTLAPPGTAKYVYCSRGRVRDFVVDLRTGSPTFGAWEEVALDAHALSALYLPPGLGHAFLALEDDTVMNYLLSQRYQAANELALAVGDPAIGLPVPGDAVLSERDRAAPSLAAAPLPEYEACLDIEAAFGAA